MNADPVALLALIAELYGTVSRLTAENAALHEQLAATTEAQTDPR